MIPLVPIAVTFCRSPLPWVIVGRALRGRRDEPGHAANAAQRESRARGHQEMDPRVRATCPVAVIVGLLAVFVPGPTAFSISGSRGRGGSPRLPHSSPCGSRRHGLRSSSW